MDKNYQIRTTCPSQGNIYYLRRPAGLSTCIAGKPLYCKNSALANCYGYAAGRFSEMAGQWEYVGKGAPRSGDWYHAADGFERGKTPRIGAMACWWRNDDTGGHVEIVEDVYPDGSVLDSYSAYNGKTFGTVRRSRSMYRSGSRFLGFIYPRYNYIKESDLKIGDRVKIIGSGNSQADGKGHAARGIGYKRSIIDYKSDADYPYMVGAMSGSRKIATGWYKAQSLKKI